MDRPTVLAFDDEGVLAVETIPADARVTTSPPAGSLVKGRPRVSVTWRGTSWTERIQARPTVEAATVATPRKQSTPRRLRAPDAAVEAEKELGFHKPKPKLEPEAPQPPLGDADWDPADITTSVE